MELHLYKLDLAQGTPYSISWEDLVKIYTIHLDEREEEYIILKGDKVTC